MSRVDAKNKLTAKALGVVTTEFKFYRDGKAHWRVVLEDGKVLTVLTHNFGTESSVLREAAHQLAKMGRPVAYPKGA